MVLKLFISATFLVVALAMLVMARSIWRESMEVSRDDRPLVLALFAMSLVLVVGCFAVVVVPWVPHDHRCEEKLCERCAE